MKPDDVPLKIVSRRPVAGIGDLYIAHRRDEPDYRIEFLDTAEPGIARSQKWVLMVSTQFGCPVACRMCDAGTMGYRGNLNTRELLAQIRTVLSAHPEIDSGRVEKLKVHFARMGEPSFNHDVLECIEHLATATRLPGLLPSLSTVAPRCPQTNDFMDRLLGLKDRYFDGGRFQLQFSIHSTDEGARRALIPIRKWTLQEISAFGRRWCRPGDRRVTLNFALADGVDFYSESLAKIFSPEFFLVKFTPVHPTRRADRNGLTKNWFEPTPRIVGLHRELESLGFKVIINPPWPQEVQDSASCGQLAARPYEALRW